MSRSTLLRALRAGALCLTATTTAAVIPAAADAQVGVSVKRLNIQTGSRVTVKGRTTAPMTASLQVQRRGRWVTLDRDRTNRAGKFVLRKRLRTAMSARARVRLNSGETRVVGRLNVYRRAQVSWYGPGLYGGHLGCGGTLTPGTLGVASKTLPCGTKVTLRHHGRTVRVPVVDRGPYSGAREFDLTAATKDRLGFSGVGSVLVTE